MLLSNNLEFRSSAFQLLQNEICNHKNKCYNYPRVCGFVQSQKIQESNWIKAEQSARVITVRVRFRHCGWLWREPLMTIRSSFLSTTHEWKRCRCKVKISGSEKLRYAKRRRSNRKPLLQCQWNLKKLILHVSIVSLDVILKNSLKFRIWIMSFII